MYPHNGIFSQPLLLKRSFHHIALQSKECSIPCQRSQSPWRAQGHGVLLSAAGVLIRLLTLYIANILFTYLVTVKTGCKILLILPSVPYLTTPGYTVNKIQVSWTWLHYCGGEKNKTKNRAFRKTKNIKRITKHLIDAPEALMKY